LELVAGCILAVFSAFLGCLGRLLLLLQLVPEVDDQVDGAVVAAFDLS
jgi:hypothetical protein